MSLRGSIPGVEPADGDADETGDSSAPGRGQRTIDRRPALFSGTLGLVVAAVGTAAVASVSSIGAAGGAAGLVLFTLAVFRGFRPAATLGMAVATLGVLLAGWFGASAVPLLVGLTGTIVAWDLTQHAIGLGQQLGREAETRRAELVHAGASVTVGGVTAAVSYGLFRTATGGQPLSALVFLLLGVVIIFSALRV